MGKSDARTNLVIDTLKKFPNTPTLTLAKKLYKENNGLWSNIESTRSHIRYYRGSSGDENRKLRENKVIPSFVLNYNPFKLPEPDTNEILPYYLPDSVKKLWVVSDLHIPYHSVESLTIAIEYALKQNIDSILINGDLCDFYSLSRWVKDPRRRSFTDELLDQDDFLTRLREIFPDQEIYFKLGNHEKRFETYLKVKAPELYGHTEFRLEPLLKLRDKNIVCVEDLRIIKKNGLNILHGHEFGKRIWSPVNPARGYYNWGKENCLAGHNHQTSEHSEKSLNDTVVTTWSTGCLCDLRPEYAPVNKWNHGFAIVEFDNGAFEVRNKRIYKNRVV